MSRPWFRLYAEFVSDPKVQLLSFDDQRHFIALLCLKCNETLDSKANPELRERMIARALGLDPATAVEVKRRLCESGLITDSWQPKQWDARQFESDTSSKRTAAYRQRKRNERHGDGRVTSQERTRSEQIQNRTEQRERARTPEVDLAQSLVPEADYQAAQDWISHRAALGYAVSPHQFAALGKTLAAFGDKAAQKSVVAAAIANGWRSLRISDKALAEVSTAKPALTWRPPPDEGART